MKAYSTLFAALVLSGAATSAGLAGPCSRQIDAAQAQFDRRLNSLASAQRQNTRPEGFRATAAKATAELALPPHHQPRAQDISGATARGEVTAADAATFVDAIERARNADDSGDASGCSSALADARQALSK